MKKNFVGILSIGLGLLGLLTLFLLEHGAEEVKRNKARADCETVLNRLKPFAEQQLSKHQSYYPFGAVLTAENKMEGVGTFDGNEYPDSTKVIEDLGKAFLDIHKSRKLLCTGIAYDVRLKKPAQPQKSDAVAVSLDHVNGYSVIVYFPYQLNGGIVEFGDSFAESGSGGIFK